MAYSDHTSMPDVLAGMAAVDPDACHEFARRQHAAGHGRDLAAAADCLHEAAFATQLNRPAELQAWKYPDVFMAIDAALLKSVLQSAAESDEAEVQRVLANESFATVTALSSIATHLRQACQQITRFGRQRPDPQQTLF